MGAMRLARNGFTRYGVEDGLHAGAVASLFEDRAGGLCVVSKNRYRNRFDGQRFTPILPKVPRTITDFGWGRQQMANTLTEMYRYGKLS